jgi:hypothetical protein
MKRILVIICVLTLSACQAHKISGVHIEGDFGNPIIGARVTMSSMHSGYPIYPVLITGPDGFAATPNKPYINSSFIFSVNYDGKEYFFEPKDFRYAKDGALVLSLKRSISE